MTPVTDAPGRLAPDGAPPAVLERDGDGPRAFKTRDHPRETPGRPGRGPLLGDAARQGAVLGVPLSAKMRLLAWLAATTIFLLSMAAWHQVTPIADVNESLVPIMALEHGDVQCAYPAHVWSAVPPLYPVLAAGVMSVTGIGKSDAAMVHFSSDCTPRYVHAVLPLLPLIVVGATGWPVLTFGFLALLSAAGRGRTRWEAVGLLALASTPLIVAAVVRYLHPEDIFAMAFVLASVAAALRARWLAAGVLIGVAFCFKQYALLPAVPLLVAAPPGRRFRYLAGALAAVAAICVPLVVLMGKGMIAVMRGVDATPSFVGTAFVGRIGLHGMLIEVVSRVLPLLGAGAAALWARHRLGSAISEPAPLVALVTVSLVLRLVFEVSLFSYYFLATAVMLVALDIVMGRIRVESLCWIVLCTAIYPPSFNPLVLVQSSHPVLAQAIVVIPAVPLAVLPLYRLCKAGPGATVAIPRGVVPEAVGA